MMKKVFTFAIAALMTLGLAAQVPQETTAAIGELTVPACTVSIQKDVKLVKGAMEQYLKDARLKTGSQQGYTVAVNQPVASIAGEQPISLYTKVDKQKKYAVVTVAVIGTDLTVDQTDLRDNAKRWLNEFVQYIARYEASQHMAAEQKNLDKAQKAADKAAKAAAAIDKAIAKDNQKIADKRKDIAKYQEKIKACEQDIKELQSDIEKQQKKKGEADAKVNAANQNVNAAQGEVDRYRQMAE